MSPSEVTRDPYLKPSSILRRYVDLSKLVDLLRTREMYLRRADGFADRLEGALFPSLRKSLDQAFAGKKISDNADTFWRKARLSNYVSCWNIQAKDNMALWQLYGGTTSSVALTTTVERLTRCASHWNREVQICRVVYVDHVKQSTFVVGRYSDPLRYKNEAYRYERELRVILPHKVSSVDTNPIAIRLPIDNLNNLIRSIVVAPECDINFMDNVTDLCKRYGLTSPVRRSMLSLVPT